MTAVNWMFFTAFMMDWNAEIVVDAAFDLLLCNLLVMVAVGFGLLALQSSSGFLGNDLKPHEEHELEFSLRKSLSIVGLRSIGKGFF